MRRRIINLQGAKAEEGRRCILFFYFVQLCAWQALQLIPFLHTDIFNGIPSSEETSMVDPRAAASGPDPRRMSQDDPLFWVHNL